MMTLHNEPINIGLSTTDRHGVASILDVLLADVYLLYTKTLNFHWNVRGPLFDPLHAFFKRQYEDLFDIADELAERIRQVGCLSSGSFHEFLKHTRLKETPAGDLTDQEMIALLLYDHESIIRSMRVDLQVCADKYHDMGTNNFLTDLMERHEKIAWMLRASLKQSKKD